jgi:hypothetical protein
MTGRKLDTSRISPLEKPFSMMLCRTPTFWTCHVPVPVKAFIEWARTTIDEGLRQMANLPAILLLLSRISPLEKPFSMMLCRTPTFWTCHSAGL